METNKLSDVKIRAAKPQDKLYSISDGEGMFLEISPKGGKWWRFKYRFNGKQKRLSLGTYPSTSLKAARDKRQQARELLASGVDPGDQRKAEKMATQTALRNTFAGVAEEWAKNKVSSEKWTPTTERKRRIWLNNGLLPFLGSRPISEITTAELWNVLQRKWARCFGPLMPVRQRPPPKPLPGWLRWYSSGLANCVMPNGQKLT